MRICVVKEQPNEESPTIVELPLNKIFPQGVRAQKSYVELFETPKNFRETIRETFWNNTKSGLVYKIAPNLGQLGSPGFSFLITRGENKGCHALSDRCSEITQSIRVNSFIRQKSENILQQIMKKYNGTFDAIHMKMWQGSFAYLPWERVMEFFGNKSNNLYIISKPYWDNYRILAKQYFKNVIWKNDFDPTIHKDYPFEVMAQIDFEIGNAISKNGTFYNYVGSSSSEYIVARREKENATNIGFKGYLFDLDPRLLELDTYNERKQWNYVFWNWHLETLENGTDVWCHRTNNRCFSGPYKINGPYFDENNKFLFS